MKDKKEILEQIRDIEARLSPENLHWDGERPIAQVRAEEKRLKAMRQKLVDELGYDPSDVEIYGH